MESNTEKQSPQSSIQDYLSLGYIYLLILGIAREVIYFGFMDINILSYSNVLDVLLSPLIYIAKDKKVIIALIIMAGLMHLLGKFMERKKVKEAQEKEEEPAASKEAFNKNTIFLFALIVFGFFMGTGIGSGYRHAQKLEKGEFTNSHQITFMNNEVHQVRLIGNNSQYVFYVLEKKQQISISPISGNIKTIVKLPPEK